MSTPTPSLTRRTIVAVLIVLTVLLALLGVTIDSVVGAQARNDLHDRLMAAVARADSLAAQGASPQRLVAETGGGGIRTRLVTAAGTSYGDPFVMAGPASDAGPPPPRPPGPGGPAGPGPGPRHHPPPPPPPVGATATVIEHPLPGGDRLILLADTTATTALLQQLRIILVLSSLGVLLVAAISVAVVVRATMSPLGRLTTVAEGIAAGDRGTRLDPDRPGTELGRAATAFDTMVDSLETSERRAHAAAAEAERADAATRQFLADAAHELRTPIAGIHAGAQQIVAAALQDLDNPAAAGQQHRAELVLTEARRAGRLVSDMLDLSRIDADPRLDVLPCDIVELADNERRRITMLAPSVTVTMNAPDALPAVVDPIRIQQILTNLGDNARRHTPADGSITIDVTGHGEMVTVTITDTGPGVPADQRERIFDRLVRLDQSRARDQGGAGLGLSIARALARAHGGDLICVDSPSGARFTVSLPARR
ncbi:MULTISPECIES: HAMP domain-containing sensor histidine kinase [Mycobacteriaceae]|uniref:histidine kinase n=1 Tax=Mycolicibacterium neoaurum VKM Ac-1815D TaxID=700508 RepID=V5XBR0_MYCNE|nr:MULTISPECIES: HAMP domain-containing sensor histidine kinase [Mycobacteriaceae]AHC25885.1 ATPase [Mycolicibacterium neoaurum VKM Ac-1815D]AMO06292.1 ATPase [Mycolicibacterium neoaurum]AXK75362.1 sensor histidine kinase [Mycolicibacterium neoaurum]KJQ50967.1 ATPase [Mycolicibacterium neoaurum]KUM08272.1 ATPase [Mycolicibacterium neoaurum]